MLAFAFTSSSPTSSCRLSTGAPITDIVDGAPATRFTERLKELVESGYALGNLAAPWAAAYANRLAVRLFHLDRKRGALELCRNEAAAHQALVFGLHSI